MLWLAATGTNAGCPDTGSLPRGTQGRGRLGSTGRDARACTSICGPEGYVKDRIAAFEAAGVTILNVLPVSPDPVRLVDPIRRWTN